MKPGFTVTRKAVKPSKSNKKVQSARKARSGFAGP